MVWPFKKRVLTYPSQSVWSVATAVIDGTPFIIRRNQSAVSLATHPEYRFRAGVAVPLNAPDADGFAGASEGAELAAIETRLAELVESEHDSLHVLAITGKGMREFLFYTRVPSKVVEAVSRVQTSVTTHTLQHYVAEDPRWAAYSQFI